MARDESDLLVDPGGEDIIPEALIRAEDCSSQNRQFRSAESIDL